MVIEIYRNVSFKVNSWDFCDLELFQITDCARNLQFRLSLQDTGIITEEDKLAAQKRHKILDQYVFDEFNAFIFTRLWKQPLGIYWCCMSVWP